VKAKTKSGFLNGTQGKTPGDPAGLGEFSLTTEGTERH